MRRKWSVWPKISACPLPNCAGLRVLAPTQPIFCCAGWRRSTSTATRCRGPNLERSKTFSEFAQCATITADAEGTSRAMPTIRRGTIIARTPRRSWRSMRSPGVHATSGNKRPTCSAGVASQKFPRCLPAMEIACILVTDQGERRILRAASDQLSLAPSRIHARMAFLSQIDSFFLPCGMRTSGEPCQSRSHIKLLPSGSRGMTIAPNFVPFIKPS